MSALSRFGPLVARSLFIRSHRHMASAATVSGQIQRLFLEKIREVKTSNKGLDEVHQKRATVSSGSQQKSSEGSAQSASIPNQTHHDIELRNFDTNNYNVPLRPITMDDTLEPYGSWQDAYEAERKRANLTLLKGIICFSGTLVFVYYSGIWEGLMLPNLDDIMDIEPISYEKDPDRISV